ncbi:class I SAM-dependent methyltransferase [Candidatus Woesearchaeota archaeon]|nr:class I SAM-dependent methyltransferase [Candidatus Woesearchaeota archaeon]
MKEEIEKKTLLQVAESKNYNRSVFGLMEKYIGKNVLEIGAGLGTMTAFLVRKGGVVATDVDKSYVILLQKRFGKNKRFKAISNDISGNIGKLKEYKFDTVVCINVLHHIRKDENAMKNIYGLLEKKGRLIVMEPAMKILFGSLDREQNHCRRYSRSEIRQKLSDAGFEVESCFMINAIGAVGWFVTGKILKRKELQPSSLGLFDRIIPLFIKIDKVLKPLVGLSVVCVCRK